jgi:cell division protein ZapA
MNQNDETSTIRILGESFRVRGGDPGEVEALARFVDEKLTEIRSRNQSLPLRSLLVLTSLNLAEELFRERKEHEDLVRTVEDRTRRLRERLELQFDPQVGVEEGR